jgi:hypothetical protein
VPSIIGLAIKIVSNMRYCCISKLFDVSLQQSMKKLQLIRHLTFLLLAAMLCAVVPVHQIFHKHHLANISIEKDSKTSHVKKAEKSCCKSFESIHGDTTSTEFTVSFNQPGSTIYTISFFAQFIKPFLQLSNKAPPVSVA